MGPIVERALKPHKVSKVIISVLHKERKNSTHKHIWAEFPSHMMWHMWLEYRELKHYVLRATRTIFRAGLHRQLWFDCHWLSPADPSSANRKFIFSTGSWFSSQTPDWICRDPKMDLNSIFTGRESLTTNDPLFQKVFSLCHTFIHPYVFLFSFFATTFGTFFGPLMNTSWVLLAPLMPHFLCVWDWVCVAGMLRYSHGLWVCLFWVLQCVCH